MVRDRKTVLSWVNDAVWALGLLLSVAAIVGGIRSGRSLGDIGRIVRAHSGSVLIVVASICAIVVVARRRAHRDRDASER